MSGFKLPSPESSGDDNRKKTYSNGNSLPSFEELLSEFENDDWNESESTTLNEENISKDDNTLKGEEQSDNAHLSQTEHNESETVIDDSEEESISHEEDSAHKETSENFKVDSDEEQSRETKEEISDSPESLPSTPDTLSETPQDEHSGDEEALSELEEHPENSSIEDDMAGDWLMGVSFDDGDDLTENSTPQEEDYSENSNVDERDTDAIAKDFFIGLKNKVLSIARRDKDPDKKKGKPKVNKRDRHEKRKEKKLSTKKRKLNFLSKVNFKSKGVIIYTGLGVLIAIMIAIFFLLNSKSYVSPSDLEKLVKHEDKDFNETIEVELKNFNFSDDKMNFTIENKGEMSANFSMNATFKKHSKNPFGKDEIECESDIINLDPDDITNESFTCQDTISNSSKYKLNVSLEKF